MGRISEAEDHYQEAQDLYRSERYNLGLANVLQSLGDLYYSNKDYSKAKYFYEQALALYSSEKDNMGFAYTCAKLARALNALGETSRRDEYLRKGSGICSKKAIFPWCWNMLKM